MWALGSGALWRARPGSRGSSDSEGEKARIDLNKSADELLETT